MVDTSSDEDSDNTPPVPVPAPKPVLKKKKALNNAVVVPNKDPDAPDEDDEQAAPAPKKAKPTTQPIAQKKRDVLAGANAPSVVAKSPKQAAVAAASVAEEGDGEEEEENAIFVEADDAEQQPPVEPKKKPSFFEKAAVVSAADDSDGSDGSEDDDQAMFGPTTAAPERSAELKAATATPHPVSTISSGAAEPQLAKTEEFLTELLGGVEYLFRGTKKRKSTQQQREFLFNFTDHLTEEGLSLTKAEFALDPAVPSELKSAVTDPSDESARSPILAIEVPFDVFLNGNEEEFLTNLCEMDHWGRQRVMACTIIATKESEPAPKPFCFFLRLKVVAPRVVEEGSEPNVEADAAWPSFEAYMNEKQREVVVSLDHKIVLNSLKALQDSIFFVTPQIVASFQVVKPRGRAAKANAAAAEPATSHIYRRFDLVNDKNCKFVLNITGCSIVKKRAPSAASLAKAALKAQTPKPVVKQPLTLDESADEDDDDEVNKQPVKKQKIKPTASSSSANDIKSDRDAMDEIIARMSGEIETRQNELRVLRQARSSMPQSE